MAKIVFGEEFVDKNTVITSLINANSPMVWDGTMLGALKVYARDNQACIVTPFILAGAMSPVTVAGTLAQVLAEVLAGAATTQLVRPGAPVLFGIFASSISMQSGAPTFGTPEPTLVSYGAGQLARRLGMPFRTGGSLCASKIPDAQAAYESAQTLLPTLLAGTNFVLHARRLARGRARLVLREVRHGRRPARHDAGARRGRRSLARTARRWTPSARSAPARRSHFLGCAHTQAQFRDGLLPLHHRRQQQLRAVAGRGRPGRAAARQQAVEEDAARNTRRRRSIPASTRRCRNSSPRRRRLCRIRMSDRR